MSGTPGPSGPGQTPLAQPHGPGKPNNAQTPAKKGSMLDQIIAKEQGQTAAQAQGAMQQMYTQNQQLQPQATQDQLMQQYNMMMQQMHSGSRYVQCRDDYGRPYYYDTATYTSAWGELPAELAGATATGAATTTATAGATSTAAGASAATTTTAPATTPTTAAAAATTAKATTNAKTKSKKTKDAKAAISVAEAPSTVAAASAATALAPTLATSASEKGKTQSPAESKPIEPPVKLVVNEKKVKKSSQSLIKAKNQIKFALGNKQTKQEMKAKEDVFKEMFYELKIPADCVWAEVLPLIIGDHRYAEVNQLIKRKKLFKQYKKEFREKKEKQRSAEKAREKEERAKEEKEREDRRKKEREEKRKLAKERQEKENGDTEKEREENERKLREDPEKVSEQEKTDEIIEKLDPQIQKTVLFDMSESLSKDSVSDTTKPLASASDKPKDGDGEELELAAKSASSGIATDSNSGIISTDGTGGIISGTNSGITSTDSNSLRHRSKRDRDVEGENGGEDDKIDATAGGDHGRRSEKRQKRASNDRRSSRSGRHDRGDGEDDVDHDYRDRDREDDVDAEDDHGYEEKKDLFRRRLKNSTRMTRKTRSDELEALYGDEKCYQDLNPDDAIRIFRRYREKLIVEHKRSKESTSSSSRRASSSSKKAASVSSSHRSRSRRPLEYERERGRERDRERDRYDHERESSSHRRDRERDRDIDQEEDEYRSRKKRRTFTEEEAPSEMRDRDESEHKSHKKGRKFTEEEERESEINSRKKKRRFTEGDPPHESRDDRHSGGWRSRHHVREDGEAETVKGNSAELESYETSHTGEKSRTESVIDVAMVDDDVASFTSFSQFVSGKRDRTTEAKATPAARIPIAHSVGLKRSRHDDETDSLLSAPVPRMSDYFKGYESPPSPEPPTGRKKAKLDGFSAAEVKESKPKDPMDLSSSKPQLAPVPRMSDYFKGYESSPSPEPPTGRKKAKLGDSSAAEVEESKPKDQMDLSSSKPDPAPVPRMSDYFKGYESPPSPSPEPPTGRKKAKLGDSSVAEVEESKPKDQTDLSNSKPQLAATSERAKRHPKVPAEKPSVPVRPLKPSLPQALPSQPPSSVKVSLNPSLVPSQPAPSVPTPLPEEAPISDNLTSASTGASIVNFSVMRGAKEMWRPLLADFELLLRELAFAKSLMHSKSMWSDMLKLDDLRSDRRFAAFIASQDPVALKLAEGQFEQFCCTLEDLVAKPKKLFKKSLREQKGSINHNDTIDSLLVKYRNDRVIGSMEASHAKLLFGEMIAKAVHKHRKKQQAKAK